MKKKIYKTRDENFFTKLKLTTADIAAKFINTLSTSSGHQTTNPDFFFMKFAIGFDLLKMNFV